MCCCCYVTCRTDTAPLQLLQYVGGFYFGSRISDVYMFKDGDGDTKLLLRNE